MSEQIYRLGRDPQYQKHVGFGVRQAARSPRYQPNNGVMQQEMRRPHVFTMFIHTLRVYRLGRGPQHQKHVVFGVCQPAGECPDLSLA